MSKTIEMIKNYVPFNEQEVKDKQFFIDCENIEQILTRENERCHLTSSGFVVNKDKTKILCSYHNIYKSWTWVGGHADGDDDMLYVAMKEAKEETSIKSVKPLLNIPISLESVPVLGHIKRGKYVPAHIHLNVTYLLEADETELIETKPDENSGVEWLTFDELLNKATEIYMIPVYKKIIEKIKVLQAEKRI
mgnify:CR=1 FL=1